MLKCNFKNAFSLLSDHYVNRYLMNNAEGRLDGAEKATNHAKMVEIYIALRYNIHPEEAPFFRGHASDGLYTDIHDHTQKLTGYLDSEIGFELTGRPSYETLVPKFIDRFLELCHEEADRSDKEQRKINESRSQTNK